jgi:hypothetical protein
MNAGAIPQTIYEKIAKVAYEANRAWCDVLGEPVNPSWDDADVWRRDSAVHGVLSAVSGAAPEDLHASWLKDRLGRGWSYGAAKNADAKTDPALVPFSALTDTQRRKFELFSAIAQALYHCGMQRWGVKTLTDPAASQVDLTPQLTEITDLITLPAPLQPLDRQAGELVTYELSGTITLAKLELDKDIHMVLSDGTNTMIIEAVDPSCAPNSRVLDQISAVRKAVETQFPVAAAGGRQVATVSATVTGVAFFDSLHGQDGVAKNGIELHPLLSFQPNGAT